MPPTEKEKSQKLQEKFQAILSGLLREEENKYCVDCDAKGPRWASWNLGVFLCIRCAGIHRNLGVHISRVKSVNLDQWTAEQIASMQAMGNAKAREIYEKNLPDNFRRSQNDSAMEQFIRAKYEQRKWIAKDWSPSNVTVSSDLKEVPSEKKKSSAKISLDANVLQVTKSTPTPTTNSNNKTQTESSFSNNNILLDFDIKETAPPAPVQVENDLFSVNFDQMNLNESNQNDLPDNSIILPTNITTTSPAIENKSAATTTNSDFDSLFLGSPIVDNNSKKIDKNSILALYGQGFNSTNTAKPPSMGIPSQPHAPPQHQQHLPGQTMIKSNSFYSTQMTANNNNHQATFGQTHHSQILNHSFQPLANFKPNNFIPDSHFPNPTNNNNECSLIDDFFASPKPSGLFN